MRNAGRANIAANRQVISPITASTPKLTKAWFDAMTSDPYPTVVVKLQSATAPPVSRITFRMLAPPSSR